VKWGWTMIVLIWAMGIVVSIAIIADATSKYNIEDVKQEAFMMKACVDAGGSWEKGWTPVHECKRALK
jgi:hypothetical protein